MQQSKSQAISELRQRTKAGISLCQKALEESSGDVEKAIEIISSKSKIIVEKKKDRSASEGIIHSYIHMAGKIGVMLEVNCETDFVARCDDFKAFCDLIALQIAGMNPKYISDIDIPEADIVKQTEIFIQQILESAPNMPEEKQNKILIGKLDKWKKESCLIYQESFVQTGKTIDALRNELISKLGENINIRRFIRWELGEGIEKVKKEDFAIEVEKLSGVIGSGVAEVVMEIVCFHGADHQRECKGVCSSCDKNLSRKNIVINQ